MSFVLTEKQDSVLHSLCLVIVTSTDRQNLFDYIESISFSTSNWTISLSFREILMALKLHHDSGQYRNDPFYEMLFKTDHQKPYRLFIPLHLNASFLTGGLCIESLREILKEEPCEIEIRCKTTLEDTKFQMIAEQLTHEPQERSFNYVDEKIN